MNMEKRNKIIIILVICYVLLYIILKQIIVYYQDLYMDNNVYKIKYDNNVNTINVKSYNEEEKSNTDYFSSTSKQYKIKIKNYFDGFEKTESDANYEYHVLYKEDNDVKGAIMLGQFPSQLSNTKKNTVDSIYYEFNYFPLYISHFSRDLFLKKHNIKNDVDLIKYIRTRKKKECTFLTPIVKIKEEFFFNFIESSFPSLDDVTYIEGDLTGYILKFDDYKQACIVKDDKLYCITFIKLDYFTDDVINDILNSVIIEK